MQLSDTLQVGDVIKCSDNRLSTDVPHYFICVAKSDESVFFSVVVTSQMEKKMEYFEKYALSGTQLVPIAPSHQNGLTKESCVSCREVFDFSGERLNELNASDDITVPGRIEEDYLEQIANGLKECELVERDVKQLLP